MNRFICAAILAMAMISSVFGQTVTGPASYSAACNATLNLLSADPGVLACAQLTNTFQSAYVQYRNANSSQVPGLLNTACVSLAGCTSDISARAVASLKADCANETQSSFTLNAYLQSLMLGPLYLQSLCAKDSVSSSYCVLDFFPTYAQWPSMYPIAVGNKLGQFSAAAGDLTQALSSQSAFILCTACSSREYSMVMAFLQNVLIGSSTLSTTSVGLPGPNPIGADVQATISNFAKMNTTISGVCHMPFLTYSIAVPPPPPPPTSNSTTAATASSTTMTSSSDARPTSASATTSGASTTSTSTTQHSGAGLRSTASFAVVVGAIALVSAMFA